jgi:hypothetical protein
MQAVGGQVGRVTIRQTDVQVQTVKHEVERERGSVGSSVLQPNYTNTRQKKNEGAFKPIFLEHPEMCVLCREIQVHSVSRRKKATALIVLLERASWRRKRVDQ